MKKTFLGLFVAFIVCCSGNLYAGIGLPEIIADHMVLKQKSKVPLWGTEEANTSVTVETSWDKKSYTVPANDKGEWMVYVQTPKAGGPYSITFKGKNTVKVNDVLIGEVWISAGQSNMAWRMRQDSQSKTMLAEAGNDNIRLFRVGRQVSEQASKTFAKADGWQVAGPETAREFSAMAYYMAKELETQLNVPVGIINASWGGTPIEAWMPNEALFASEILQAPVKRWNKWVEDYEQDSLLYTEKLEKYKQDKKGKEPKLPQSMYMMRRQHRKHSVLYNGMVAPCAPYALSGMFWYQGTSNVDWSDEYELQLNTLIKTWRDAFQLPDMPAIVGQLTAYKYGKIEKAYIMREAQLNQRNFPHTYVFCSIDHGELKDVHPRNKQPYGQRAAWMALNKVYGKKKVACMSPSFKSMKAEDGKLVISFHDAKGLHIKGSKLEAIYIAGENGEYFPAKAEVKKDCLIVSSSEVPHPVSVHYQYENNEKANLFNGDKLPAFPFRAKL